MSEPYIIAHRGGLEFAQENTLSAFHSAWDFGADAIEGDFHKTKDGYIVCIHDDTTGRTCNQNLVVKESTLETLRSLDAGSGNIPTLHEFVECIPPGKKGYIEIKCHQEIVPDFLTEFHKCRHHERVVIISFYADTLYTVKKLYPALKTILVSDFFPGEEERLLETAIAHGLNGIDVDGTSSLLTKEYIDKAHNLGLEVHTWTINDPLLAKRLLKLGVDSITTDKPGAIRTYLNRSQ